MSAETQGSLEWHEARRLPEPASAIAALTGDHPYLTIPKYIRQRVRQLARAESEFVMVPAVEHGQNMEDTARKFLEKLNGYTIRETGSIVHPEYDFIQASADGLIGLDGCAEFKCPYPFLHQEALQHLREEAKHVLDPSVYADGMPRCGLLRLLVLPRQN